jgi:hypothetical protein
MVVTDLESDAGTVATTGSSTIVRDVSDVGDLSATVVIAIAEFFGTDPEQLEPRLYDRLDPDALQNLFDSSKVSGNVTVSIALDGARLEIQDGTVRVSESPEPPQ